MHKRAVSNEVFCQAETIAISPVKCAQETAFGAVFDVLIDIISRGVVWAWAIPGPLGVLPPLLEAFTFICTHSVSTRKHPRSPWPLPMALKCCEHLTCCTVKLLTGQYNELSASHAQAC